MALVEQTMTEKNLEAHRRNGRQSHGAATPEGKERARAANLRHGYYSDMRDDALVALGEDPADLAALVEGVRQQFRPANDCQEWITSRLASMQWRMQRAERQQESKVANHIRQFEAKRREAARQLRARSAVVLEFLGDLRHAVARPDFYTPNGCFEQCQDVLQQYPSASLEPILELLHRLRMPDRFTDPAPPPLPAAMTDQEWQEVLNSDEADESSVPAPEIPIAEAEDRDSLREKLWNLAAEETRFATEHWQKAIAAQEAPLSPRSRDLLALEVSKELELMRREERSCFREFARLIRDLMKLQKESEVRRAKSEGKPQGESEVRGPKSEGADHHQRPQEQDLRTLAQDSRTGDAAERAPIAVAPAVTALQAQNSGGDGAENTRKNAGASGYVEENTGGLLADGEATPPRCIMQAEDEGHQGRTL